MNKQLNSNYPNSSYTAANNVSVKMTVKASIDPLGRMTVPKIIREKCKVHSTGKITVELISDNSVVIRRFEETKSEPTQPNQELKKTLMSCINELVKKLKEI